MRNLASPASAGPAVRKVPLGISLLLCVLVALLIGAAACSYMAAPPRGYAKIYRVDPPQTELWSSGDDLEFFLHGTMSSEFIPERVLQAYEFAHADLFPGESLTAFGVLAGEGGGLPIGFSRRVVPHLGGLSSVGINCAACHVGEVRASSESPPQRILGRASPFNIYAFSGSVAVAMARTLEPAGMEKFLTQYLRAGGGSAEAQQKLAAALETQRTAIAAAIADDPFASKSVPANGLHDITPADLELDGKRLEGAVDLVPLVRSHLKLLRNMRTALHVPEQLPPPVPTLPGPGRTDAFGVLAASFFGFPTRFEAPVKFGITWNLADRKYVHWDANCDQPLARNLGAALGLGAPMAGQGRLVDFESIRRHTLLSEGIRSPRYPWTIDAAVASRGAEHYKSLCASCHNAPEEKRLFAPAEVGTDPNRALFFDAHQADLLNKWLAALEVPGFTSPAASFRSTGKYWASDMSGVWARSPYLHNGSVRTLKDLLSPPAARPASFRTGGSLYDAGAMGNTDEGPFTFDTALPGNAARGHDYGTSLPEPQKLELIEFLKTL